MDATDRLDSLLVADVMSKHVATLGQCQSMEAAAHSLLEQGVSSAPVVDESGNTTGILTATDYVRRAANEEPHVLSPLSPCESVHMEEVLDRVASYMSTAVQSVQADDKLLHAAKVMIDSHLHRLPVMSGSQTVGMVSTMDVVAALLNVISEKRTFGAD